MVLHKEEMQDWDQNVCGILAVGARGDDEPRRRRFSNTFKSNRATTSRLGRFLDFVRVWAQFVTESKLSYGVYVVPPTKYVLRFRVIILDSACP